MLDGMDSFEQEEYEKLQREQRAKEKRKGKKRVINAPASPLQRAQRDRQSVMFMLAGGVGNIKQALKIAESRYQLFTDDELAAMAVLKIAACEWHEKTSPLRKPEGYNAWEEVKKNLVSSVDNAEKKV